MIFFSFRLTPHGSFILYPDFLTAAVLVNTAVDDTASPLSGVSSMNCDRGLTWSSRGSGQAGWCGVSIPQPREETWHRRPLSGPRLAGLYTVASSVRSTQERSLQFRERLEEWNKHSGGMGGPCPSTKTLGKQAGLSRTSLAELWKAVWFSATSWLLHQEQCTATLRGGADVALLFVRPNLLLFVVCGPVRIRGEMQTPCLWDTVSLLTCVGMCRVCDSALPSSEFRQGNHGLLENAKRWTKTAHISEAKRHHGAKRRGS